MMMEKQIIRLTKVNDELVQEVLDLTSKERDVLSSYIKIRNKYFELHRCEEQSDHGCSELRSELNDLYQDFNQLFGRLNKTRTKNLLLTDPYGFLICASLEYKTGGNSYAESDVLTRSPKGEIEIYRTSDCVEGMAYCLSMKGEIDLDYIGEITDKEPDEILLALGDRIYYEPLKCKWVTSEEWLSGNVHEKMIKTEELLSKLRGESPVG